MMRSTPKALLLLSLTFLLLGFATSLGSSEVTIIPDGVDADPPSGWVHRPLLEFFTGLSCPSCMGDSPTADSPEKAVHDTFLKSREDESVPHATVVFHELNGGGVDDLNNQDATDRMKYYQPGLSGTPDVEIDGGYVELGGFSTSTRSIDESNVEWALEEARQRHNNAPLRPVDRLTWSFPYIILEVDQIYQDGQFAVVGKVTYDGNAKIMPTLQELQGSLYVFMVEDGVEAYSMVYDQFVNNDAVFRGYALEDERFSLRDGNTWEFSASWPVPEINPENGVPVKPQNVYAVAAVYDTQDTDSAPSVTDGNQKGTLRCLQSATSDSTAYDRENTPPTVNDVTYLDGTVTVVLEDEGGIANAVVFYNIEAANSSTWLPLQLELQGEELCDDSGVCYAYSDPIGTATLEHDGGPLYMQVLANDDQMAQGRSEVFSVGDSSSDSRDKGSSNLSFNSGFGILAVGLAVILIAVILYIVSKNKKGNFFKLFSSKGTLAVLILLGLIMTMWGGAGLFTKDITTVPEFAVTDTNEVIHTPATYDGKVLVIDIMFTTCSICIKEMPDVVSVYEQAKEKWGDDVEFLSVSVDDDDTDALMNQFQDKYGAEWSIGMDDSFIDKFEALEVPKMVIIAPNGDIAYQHVGYIDKGDVLSAIEDAHEGNYKVSTISQAGGSIVAIGFLAATFGILTFFSPCSFPMLPGYFMYYISNRSKQKGKKENPMKGGSFAALGIITFFLIIGILVAIFSAAIQKYLLYLMPVVGGILLTLGILTLIGKDQFLERGIEAIKYPFQKLWTKFRGEKQSESSGSGGLFAYGFGYGAAASSCMAPAFVGVILLGSATPLKWVGAIIVFVAYTVAIAAMMIVFSFMAASGGKGMEKFISSTDKVKKISGLLLVFAGAFVLWYSFFGYKYFTFLSF